MSVPAMLRTDSGGGRIAARLAELAALTDEPGVITRLYLSRAHRRAVDLVSGWMREAGMSVRMDPLGTVVSRMDGPEPDAPVLYLGSHIDTVRNAGAYDGAFGVVAAIEVVAALWAARLPLAIEVLAFGDEEGVRFPTTLTGSRAVAGLWNPAVLDEADEDGVTRREALAAFGCDPAADPLAFWGKRPSLGYLETHIEQGPVLERENLPLGVVTAIAGARRGHCRVVGKASHSGTTPMAARHDALTAAAAMVLAVEKIARAKRSIVATVGQIATPGGAINTVPGEVVFSLDVRSADDAARDTAWDRIAAKVAEIAASRGVEAHLDLEYQAPAAVCHSALCSALSSALFQAGLPDKRLVSGAGHDAMAFRGVLPFAMLFVRCRDGLSHHPDEYALPADMQAGADALTRAVQLIAAGL
jgi:allantoate deiminase